MAEAPNSPWVGATPIARDQHPARKRFNEAATQQGMQSALGLQKGVDVQAYDAALQSVADLAVVQGDLLYGSAADTLARLAKNASTTRYLSNTGTNNNPAWAQVNLANGVTGTLPVANGGTGDTGTAYASYTPTVTASAGTFTTTSASGAFKVIGKTCFIRVRATITTVGTASGILIISLPAGVTAVTTTTQSIIGIDSGSITVRGGLSATGIRVVRYDATTVIAAGQQVDLSGSFEVV